MSPTVTVGVDGSSESIAAADWAAREAARHAVPLRLLHAWEQRPRAYAPIAGAAAAPPDTEWSERMLGEAEARLTRRHPGLRIIVDQIAGDPATALLAAAGEAELLVLGSRGLARTAGLLLGSVGLAVLARAERPVVLVRADAPAADQHEQGPSGTASEDAPYRDVVLGLDLNSRSDAVIGFAFDAASRRGAALRVVNGWNPPASTFTATQDRLEDAMAAYAQQRLAEVLRPWRGKYPGVRVTEEAVIGRSATHLTDASRDASLLVVGRRIRRSPLGSHIGAVTHTVLHHAAAPVAVVPHD